MTIAAFYIFTSLPAAAVPRPPPAAAMSHAACGRMLMPITEERPDPFTVDPIDVTAILNFINEVTPWKPSSEPWAMQDGLKNFWRVYLPELTDADLVERVSAFDGSNFALQVVRRAHIASLKEKGRLRITWLKFLIDVAHPDNPPVNPRIAEHARSLMVQRYIKPIVAYLGTIVPFPVEESPASVIAAVEHLWTRDFNRPAPVFDVDPAQPWHITVSTIWSRYVEAIDAVPNQSMMRGKNKSRYRVDRVVDLSEVEVDARAIAVYLISRYPRVPIQKPDALRLMFQRLRADHGLARCEDDFGLSDLKRILYDRLPPPRPGAGLEHAWITFLEDLGRAGLRSAAE